jgi:hypothetical protein
VPVNLGRGGGTPDAIEASSDVCDGAAGGVNRGKDDGVASFVSLPCLAPFAQVPTIPGSTPQGANP